MTNDNTKTVTISEARDGLSELAHLAHYRGTRVVITRRGKPFAVLVGLGDLEVLEAPREWRSGSRNGTD